MRVLGKGEGGRPAGKPGVQRPRSTDKPCSFQEKDQARPHKSPQAGLSVGGYLRRQGDWKRLGDLGSDETEFSENSSSGSESSSKPLVPPS